MIILVCGGRKFNDYVFLASAMNRILDDRKVGVAHDSWPTIIHGGAGGADRLADRWACNHYYPIKEFAADWADTSHPGAVIRTSKNGVPYDVTAGFRRNQQMLDEGRPDLVVAFPGGSGTADMVRRARAANVEVKEISYEMS